MRCEELFLQQSKCNEKSLWLQNYMLLMPNCGTSGICMKILHEFFGIKHK